MVLFIRCPQPEPFFCAYEYCENHKGNKGLILFIASYRQFCKHKGSLLYPFFLGNLCVFFCFCFRLCFGCFCSLCVLLLLCCIHLSFCLYTYFVVVAAQLRLASFCPLSLLVLPFSSVKFLCFCFFLSLLLPDFINKRGPRAFEHNAPKVFSEAPKIDINARAQTFH